MVGKPTDAEREAMQSPFAHSMLESIDFPTSPKGWAAQYPDASADALDLLHSLMQFDPNARITALQGLQHPYCAQFHDAESEPCATAAVNIQVQALTLALALTIAPAPALGLALTAAACTQVDDNDKKQTHFYREMLYQEINNMKKKEKRGR